MSLQDSTFNTAHVQDNEIVKANDFEFAFESLITNVSKSTQMFLESNQDFVINGKVLPYQGMNVEISPIFGVCKSTGVPFGRTETATMEYGFEESTSGRVDIIEVQGDWETYDNQQRAFNDPDTDTQTYQYVDTKKLMKPVYRIKKGVEGGSTAPEVDDGWVKLAEVVIRPNNSTILATDIKNITSDVAGEDNEDWTTEPDITYNIGYISDVNARFREQHNADGTHKDNVINRDSLNIGTGAKQIHGNILPVGGSVSIPNETIAATDSILSVIVKAAAMLTSLYNAYLKFSSSGIYGFNGDLQISSLLDANEDLVKPISISAAGDGTAVIKVDGNTVLSIDANGKLSTNGYTASSNDHIVTKVVTDGLKSLIDALDTRVTNIENLSDPSGFANGVLSSGTTGRYNPDNTQIYAATTANVTLSGSQTIDGTTPTNGSYILVKNQTNPKENGIYQYASSSAWTRVTAFATPASMKGKLFSVSAGTNNGNKMFYMTNWNFTDGTAFGSDDIEILEYFGAMKAVANKVIMRDANGRAKVAAPSESDDIARKAEIDALYSTTVKGTALGTAAVGSCTTFARSDHVHPIPYCVHTSSDTSNWFVFTRYNIDTDCRYRMDISDSCGGTTRYGIRVAAADIAYNSVSAASASNSNCLGCRTSAQYIRNCNGSDIGVNANLGTYHTMTISGPNACWNHVLNMGWTECSGCDSWASQITVPTYNSTARMGYRCHCGNTTYNSWNGWTYLIDDKGGQTINGTLTATTFCGALSGCATDSAKLTGKAPSSLCVACAGANGSGTAFGTAATCAATAFRSCTWWPNCISCGCVYNATHLYHYVCCLGKTCAWIGDIAYLCYTSANSGTMTVYNCSGSVMIAISRHVINNTWLCAGAVLLPGTNCAISTYWNCCSGTLGCEYIEVAII